MPPDPQSIQSKEKQVKRSRKERSEEVQYHS